VPRPRVVTGLQLARLGPKDETGSLVGRSGPLRRSQGTAQGARLAEGDQSSGRSRGATILRGPLCAKQAQARGSPTCSVGRTGGGEPARFRGRGRFIKLYPNHPNVDLRLVNSRGPDHFKRAAGAMRPGSPRRDMSEPRPESLRATAFLPSKEVVTLFAVPPNPVRRRHRRADALPHQTRLANKRRMHVAKFYMKRGAYVAAANRGGRSNAIEPLSAGGPAVEEAM